MYNHRNFNVQRSAEDDRDFSYEIQNIPLRREIDLREWDSPVEDQGNLGSCVSHALTSCYELMTKKQFPEKFTELSRLFAYYHTRVLEETVNEDAGVIYIRDALKASSKYGLCNESLWPYNIDKFKDQPSPACYLDASMRKISFYRSLSTHLEILEALNQSKPILIGVLVHDNFLTINNKNPEMTLPGVYDFVVGGHSMSIVGYSLQKRQFIVKNSFGTEWGDSGYCWMPFEYCEKFVFEKWIFDPRLQDTEILM